MQEMRSVYYMGIENHLRNTYNLFNWLILTLYVGSFVTRFIADRSVSEAEQALGYYKVLFLFNGHSTSEHTGGALVFGPDG